MFSPCSPQPLFSSKCSINRSTSSSDSCVNTLQSGLKIFSKPYSIRDLGGVGERIDIVEGDGERNLDMPQHERPGRRFGHAHADDFVHRFLHDARGRRGHDLRRGRLEQRHMLDRDAMALGNRREHRDADPFGLPELLFRALLQRDDDVLLRRDASEHVLARFRRILLLEQRRMAGMRRDEMAIVAKRDLLRVCRRGIQQNDRRIRLQPRDDRAARTGR